MGLSDKDWDRRVLCSDGNCIGVVGPDGRCKVCGLRYAGDLPSIADDGDIVDDETDAFQSEPRMPEGEAVEEDKTVVEKDGAGDEWESRTLCADEGCIGVIGPDGKCKECGKPNSDSGDD